MPSIALALAALKPGPCHPRQRIADPTVQMLASFLVLLALFPLLAPLMGRPYALKPATGVQKNSFQVLFFTQYAAIRAGASPSPPILLDRL